MLPSLTTLLLFQVLSSLALSLQFGNVLPKLVRDVSSRVFSHNAYVDQKGHQTPSSLFNHEQWHQRHVLATTNVSSIAYMTLSAPTGSLSTMTLGLGPYSASGSANSSTIASMVSAMSSASASRNSSSTIGPVLPLPSASATARRANSLASLIGPTEDLLMDKSANWDDETEAACSTALITLHGVATNPSGIAACYNIESLDNFTGIFEVDLRLYRISAPADGWLKLDPSSVGVGLSYMNATVSATKSKKAKREDRTLPWFPAQRDEAADIYIRRSTGVPPRRLGFMTFAGTVEHGALAELNNMTTALSLLTPLITLSGREQDGTGLNARLSIQDASFVNGVFASTGAAGSQSTQADVNELILPGTKLVEFPIGLIITSIWAVLYSITMGYGTISRYQARESYRRRVKHKFSGDAVTKRKMRWA